MNNLIIIGAGGHGKVVFDCALSMNAYSKIIFVDSRTELIGSCVLECPVHSENDFPGLAREYSHAIVAIGDNRIRLEKTRQIQSMGLIPAKLIHASAVVSRFATIGNGTVILANALVNPCANIADACIINSAAVIEHDCVLSDGVHVSPGAALGGGVFVGKNTWLGIGSSIANNLHIGENTVIGAGAVVINDIEDNVMAAGVPAVIKKYRP